MHPSKALAPSAPSLDCRYAILLLGALLHASVLYHTKILLSIFLFILFIFGEYELGFGGHGSVRLINESLKVEL